MTTTTTLDQCAALLDTEAPFHQPHYLLDEEADRRRAEATRIRAEEYAAITERELVSEDRRVFRHYSGTTVAEVLRQIADDLDEWNAESDQARGEPRADPNKTPYPYGTPTFSVGKVHYRSNRSATEIHYRVARRRELTPEQIEHRAQYFLQKWTPPVAEDVPF